MSIGFDANLFICVIAGIFWLLLIVICLGVAHPDNDLPWWAKAIGYLAVIFLLAVGFAVMSGSSVTLKKSPSPTTTGETK